MNNKLRISISPTTDNKTRAPGTSQVEGGYRLRLNLSHQTDCSQSPLISIITVVRNGEKTLEQTIKSVLKQANSYFEYIIIDGASTDSTLDIIRKYDNEIAYWVSESDTGIYNAMNKGWQLCQGHYVYYLGADDTLLTLPIEELMTAKMQNKDIVYGNVLFSDGKLFKSKYGVGLIFNNTLHHQGLFLKHHKELIQPFNEEFKIFADFDLNQRLLKQKSIALSIDKTIALFSIAGASNNTTANEFFRIIRKNYGVLAVVIAFYLCKIRGLQSRLSQLRRAVQ